MLICIGLRPGLMLTRHAAAGRVPNLALKGSAFVPEKPLLVPVMWGTAYRALFLEATEDQPVPAAR